MNHPRADTETVLCLQIRDLSQDSVDTGGERERERDGVCVSVDTGRMNAHLFPRLSLKTQNHGGYLCSVNLPGHVLVDTENVVLLLERNTNPSQFWLISIFLFASG